MIDVFIFRSINNLAGGSLDTIGLFFGGLAIFVVLVAALIPIFVARKWMRSMRILLSAALAFIVSEILKSLVHRPRPFVALQGVHTLIVKGAEEWSFPSGHASAAFAIAFGLWFWNRRVGSAALILALLIGLGRVYVGVHYPSDILGGAFVGFISAWILFRKR